jgi:translation initiation factor 5B
MMSLATICKVKILPQYVFHNSNPAIFGVKIEAGKLKSNTPLMNESGEEVERVRKIQIEKDSVEEATVGMEVAISLGGTNFERQLADKEYLYSDISSKQFKAFKDNKDLLTREETEVLQKISQIKRAKEPGWGL